MELPVADWTIDQGDEAENSRHVWLVITCKSRDVGSIGSTGPDSAMWFIEQVHAQTPNLVEIIESVNLKSLPNLTAKILYQGMVWMVYLDYETCRISRPLSRPLRR